MNIFDRFSLAGKRALVTGASHGIGEAMAVDFAAAGADVALAARTVADLERVAGRIREHGRRAVVIPTDVSDLAQIERMLDRAFEELGGVDILANVAGVNRRKRILEVTPDDWEFIVNINLRGVYFASQAFARQLIDRGAAGGKIIHIASMTSYRGFKYLSVYGITKTAIVSLARTQAVEWAQHNIQVNAIAPGWIKTPLTDTMHPVLRDWVDEHVPQGHYGTTDDLTGIVLYLASSASDYTTGQTFPIDGGFVAGQPWPDI